MIMVKKADPCGTTVEMFFHADVCPFKGTCCCQS